jgi:ubiquinone/menaquinone biosynthesis C-methylase UbiE
MGGRLRQHEYRDLARQVVEMGVPAGGRVLDVGTGPGFVAIAVARLLQGSGCQVVGLDLSQAMLALAAENAAQAGLNTPFDAPHGKPFDAAHDELTWRVGDAKNMPFEDGEFDFVISNDSLHHWDDPVHVLNEIARVLKDDGQCIVHDSKRLHSRAPRLVAGAIGMLIPSDFRVHYWNSIKSSYTPPELRSILERSRLQGARVVEGFMDLTIVKEA